MTDYSLELRVAEAIAREAGHRVVRAARGEFGVALKSQNDYVTTVDTATEKFVAGALAEAFPDDAIRGEEGANTGDGQRRWFIDPIDGTTNFVRDVPMYCVSIGLHDGDRWVVGVVYEPNRDELFSGRVGGRPFLNGTPIAVSKTARLEQAVTATGFPPQKASANGNTSDDYETNLDNFQRVMGVTRAVRRLGSAAIDLAYVACGRLDGFWEYHLNPWDVGAGALLVELAGGRVTTAAAQPYTGFDRSILATNTLLHDELVETLRTS